MTANKSPYSLFFLLLFFFATKSFIFAQTTDTIEQKVTQLKTRPSVAVVLAGGGARGFVHIPVLEMLEEEGIPIDIVIGTSAGAIVGGLYCAGYTPHTIMQDLGYLNWSSLFQDKVTSPFEKTLGNHSIYSTPFALKLANQNKNISLQMGASLLTGQRAYEELKQLTMRIPSNTDFDTLPTPFRAISVDLLTGKLLILSEGDLAEAMRCSMSIPGLFQPFLLDGHYCVDGMAQDNNPIDIAHELGYDIIIDVDFGSTLETDYNAFKNNPLIAINQMMNMPTNTKNLENYKYADIVMLPDYGGHSLVDYDAAEDIYNTAKADIERYRPQIKEIKKKIDSWNKTNTNSTLLLDKNSLLMRNKESTFSKNYFDNPLPNPAKIVINSESLSTINYASNYFNDLKEQNKYLSSEKLQAFSEAIYNTGKFDTVTTRINRDTEEDVLEIGTISKEPENHIILLGTDFIGTIAADSTSELNLTTDIQFRGLTGIGSVLSFKMTFLDDLEAELMYMQPIGAHFFIEWDNYYLYDHSSTGSGFVTTDSDSLLTQEAKTSLTLGLPISSYNAFTGGISLNWQDTTQEVSYGDESTVVTTYETYTFNKLDHTLFPSKGAYVSLTNTSLFPVPEIVDNSLIDIASMDVAGAISLKNSFSLLFGGFAGSNMDQRLNKKTDLIPVYGFTTADRRFFPQIADRSNYGIEKAAICGGIQFAPWDQLTLIGGKAFFAVTGAIGNVWDSFDTITLDGLEWRSSFDAGLRITDAFGMVLRIGAGTTKGYTLPFVSFDLGNIRY